MEFTPSEAKQWALKNVRGFYMCPITPLQENGLDFDEEAMRANIEAYIEMGVDGLVVGGFIAECWNMKFADWLRYHQVVADAVKGRVDIWTIILDPSVHQSLQKMEYVERLGYSGAEVINPIVQLRTDDEVYDYFAYMAERSPLAICLYRTPVSGKVMGMDLMKRLADIDTVIGVKQGELSRAVSLKMRREMRDDFIVMDPAEHWYLDEQKEGGQVLWGELSFILYGNKRHLMKDYVRLAAEGDWAAATEAWRGLTDVRRYFEDEFLWTVANTFTYAGALSTLKIWYEEIGLKAGPVMPPLKNPPAERRQVIADKLNSMQVS